jgi:pyrimidine operon attenuation protein/uracil phosphoribosyltransferase
MSDAHHGYEDATVVMNADTMADVVEILARDIAAATDDIESLVLLGILTRGKPLAERIAARIGEIAGHSPRVGALATTLYRDDLRSGKTVGRGEQVTHFDFDVNGATVLLVDDVLSTGRTVRAALDEIVDYGRPKRIQLACLVDRGHRELPIQADFLGQKIPTDPYDHVRVRLSELDGEDAVLLERRSADPVDTV